MIIKDLVFSQKLYLETEWITDDGKKYFMVVKYPESNPIKYTVRINNMGLKRNNSIDIDERQLKDFLNIPHTDE